MDPSLKEWLDTCALRYNHASFVKDDPICIPYRYTVRQDIEIAAFLTSMLAWGRRKTIIMKVEELLALMDDRPYHFIITHEEKDRERFVAFKHRTFQYTDTLYFLDFLQRHYSAHDSLQEAFLTENTFTSMEVSLIQFHERFFDAPYAPQRTRKHVSTPARKSACKRLNMFLRWMVRKDECGVDFGIWNDIPMSALMIPLDVHVARVAHRLGLLTRKQRDWRAVKELTQILSSYDPDDPVRYDFALFGAGVYDDYPL